MVIRSLALVQNQSGEHIMQGIIDHSSTCGHCGKPIAEAFTDLKKMDRRERLYLAERLINSLWEDEVK